MVDFKYQNRKRDRQLKRKPVASYYKYEGPNGITFRIFVNRSGQVVDADRTPEGIAALGFIRGRQLFNLTTGQGFIVPNNPIKVYDGLILWLDNFFAG